MNEPGAPSPVVPTSSPVTPPQFPLSFGQILDRVFALVRRNWGKFLAIASLPAGLMVVLYMGMIAAFLWVLHPWHPQLPNPAEIMPKIACIFAVLVVFYLLFMVVYALYEPAAVFAALQATDGVKVRLGKAYGLALRKAGRYIWLTILRCLIVAGPILLLVAVVGGCVAFVFARAKGHFDPSTAIYLFPLFGVLYCGSLLYAIVAFVWLSLATPACVAENIPAHAGIRRSVQLTKGGRGRLFLLLLVLYAICYAAMLIAECVFMALGSIAALLMVLLHAPLNPWGFVAIGVGGFCLFVLMFLFIAFAWSAYTTTFAVVYRDQRLRKDGMVAAAPLIAGTGSPTP